MSTVIKLSGLALLGWIIFAVWLGSSSASALNVTYEFTPANAQTINCSGTAPVNFVAYPSHNPTTNTATGRVNYTVNIDWRRCNNPHTRAYAIFATGSDEDKNELCPLSGTYAASRSHLAYDCVKYIGDPAWHAPDSNLTCPGGTNSDCVENGFGAVRMVENEPDTTLTRKQKRDYNKSRVIPNWGTEKLSNGSFTIGRGNGLCQFYKKASNLDIVSGNLCKDFKIKVIWKPEWVITPLTSVSPSSLRVGSTITWTHTIRNTGESNTTRVIKYRFTPGTNTTTSDSVWKEWSAGKANGATSTTTYKSTYVVGPNDIGKQICRTTTATPRSWNNNSAITGAQACATVLPPVWDISATTTADRPANSGVRVGQSIKWTHALRNNGPDKTYKQVTYTINPTNHSPTGTTTGTIPIDWASGLTKTYSTDAYTVTPQDVGKQLCQNISATNKNWQGSSVSSTAWCVYVPYEYELMPRISSSDAFAEPGDSVSARPSVENTGPTISEQSSWEVYRYVFNKNTTAATIDKQMGETAGPGNDVCSFHAGWNAGTCQRIASGNQTFNTGILNLAPLSQSLGDLEAGSKVCFSLSLSPWRSNTPASPQLGRGWRHSQLACTTIVIKPIVHVQGGDVAAGVAVPDNGTCSGAGTPGVISWSRGTPDFQGSATTIAAFAPGNIDGFATSQLRPTSGEWWKHKPSSLAFARVNSNSAPSSVVYGGGYTVHDCMSDYFTMFEGAASVYNGNLNSLFNQSSGTYQVDSSQQIGGPATVTIQKGKQFNIYIDGDFIIDRNFTYQRTGWNTRDDIPALRVVVTGNIYIDKSVTNLDGIFLAKGTIYTCTEGGTIISDGKDLYDQCQNKLVVNGVLGAKNVKLLRSSGTAIKNERAEKINYLPEVWLASWPLGSGPAGYTPAANYDSIINLPPVL